MKPPCRECGVTLKYPGPTGLCIKCVRTDPDTVAKRAAGIAAAFKLDPAKAMRRREAVAEANRRPERRERSRQLCKARRLWEAGHAAYTAEVHARAARTNSERKLAHIPLAYRDDYARLVRKVGAAEARRMIDELANKAIERAHA